MTFPRAQALSMLEPLIQCAVDSFGWRVFDEIDVLRYLHNSVECKARIAEWFMANCDWADALADDGGIASHEYRALLADPGSLPKILEPYMVGLFWGRCGDEHETISEVLRNLQKAGAAKKVDQQIKAMREVA